MVAQMLFMKQKVVIVFSIPAIPGQTMASKPVDNEPAFGHLSTKGSFTNTGNNRSYYLSIHELTNRFTGRIFSQH